MKLTASIALLALLAATPGMARAAMPDPDPAGACERAAAAAERAHGLPPGILAAIGRVESGQRDPLTGQLRPWPWTLDAAGRGAALPSPEAAMASVAEQQKAGIRSIDVGCFQVNLEQHPQAFMSLAEAFDPDRNADYAARFLLALEQRSGSWPDAVMAYHSATPARGIPYRDRVLASWGMPAAPVSIAPPVMQVPGLHIWTPAAPGAAPAVITLAHTGFSLPIVHHLAAP